MIRQALSAVMTGALLLSAGVAKITPEAAAQTVVHDHRTVTLRVLDMTVKPSKNKPITVLVKWEANKIAPDARIDGYEITLDLTGNGTKGQVFQTPQPSLTQVHVGLLGIDAEKRARLFTADFPTTATVTLKAKIFGNGKLREVVARKTLTL